MIWRWLERQNYSYGNMVVDEKSCFSGRLNEFWLKEGNGRRIGGIEVGGPTLIKTDVYCVFPRHSFRPEVGKLQVCKHSSNQMVNF